jgi:hypothetical protein
LTVGLKGWSGNHIGVGAQWKSQVPMTSDSPRNCPFRQESSGCAELVQQIHALPQATGQPQIPVLGFGLVSG